MTTHTLRGFGILGILLFLPIFLFTFADPQLIESSGRTFVEWRVKQEVFDKIDSASVPKSFSLERVLGDKAKALQAKAEKELAIYKQKLKNDAPAMIAKRIAEARNLDCECRKKWEDTLRQSLILHIKSIEDAQQKLEAFTQAKYMDVVQKLTLDVRIFLETVIYFV